MAADRARIAILGGGPAGLAAGWLLQRQGAEVTLFEAAERPGGLAASLNHDGLRVDLGSHRLHAACQPRILQDLRGLLQARGGDLLWRRRRGRIRIGPRWLPFPLSPMGLIMGLPPGLLLSIACDLGLRRTRPEDDSFRSLVEDGFGPSLARRFYFPYTRKVWGLEPDDLDPELARKRIAGAGGWREKVRAMISGRGRGFYYPDGGFGALPEALAAAFKEAGGRLKLNTKVVGLDEGGAAAARVRVLHGGDESSFEAELVLSSLPLTLLARLLDPACESGLRHRSLVLVYASLDSPRFSPFDAHYFPDDRTRASRVSEPKNYSGAAEPAERTALCIEVPCWAEDAVFEEESGPLVTELRAELAACGLAIPEPRAVRVERRRFAYPVFERGYREGLGRLQAKVDAVPWLLSLGRQGLFAHDNTHHALATAYAAARCIRGGVIDRRAWEGERAAFDAHRVED